MDRFDLGDLAVHRVEEIVDPNCDGLAFFPDLTPEILSRNLHWLAPRFWDVERNFMVLTMQTWVLKTRHHTVLVDTCNGNHKDRPLFPVVNQLNTPYLDRLRAVGCAPEDVDFVLCTHMHVDHVGWNTRLEDGRWVPTFPNAKYLFSRKEYEQYLPENFVNGEAPMFLNVFEDSVLPVIAAGQAQFVDGGYQVNESVAIDPAPGHTPGHYIVRAGSAGNLGVFVGDAIHNPIQIAEPQISTAYCTDRALAARTRLRILEDCAEHGHLLVPTHFAPPYVGRVERSGDRFRFVY